MNPTPIEYAEFTSNPMVARDRRTGRRGWFCVKCSPGCSQCYAEKKNLVGRGNMGTKLRFTAANAEGIDLSLNLTEIAAISSRKKPALIFMHDMTDWMLDLVPDAVRDATYSVMERSPQHLFITLTKRSEELRRFLDSRDRLPNHIAGVSVEDAAYRYRIADLAGANVACRMVSFEPLMGPVVDPKQSPDFVNGPNADWWFVIGGMSGPDADPMHPDWPRDILAFAESCRIPTYFKQWGEFSYHEIRRGSDGNEHFSAIPWVIDPALPWKLGNKTCDRMAWSDGDGWKPMRDLVNDLDARVMVDGRIIACRVGKSARRLDGVKVTRRCIDGRTHDGEPALMTRWRQRIPDLYRARKLDDLDACRRILSETP